MNFTAIVCDSFVVDFLANFWFSKGTTWQNSALLCFVAFYAASFDKHGRFIGCTAYRSMMIHHVTFAVAFPGTHEKKQRNFAAQQKRKRSELNDMALKRRSFKDERFVPLEFRIFIPHFMVCRRVYAESNEQLVLRSIPNQTQRRPFEAYQSRE